MKSNADSAHAQQWGLPDWRDAAAYPNHKRVTLLRWCWEFLRRNPDYREFWLRVEAQQQALGPLDQPLEEPFHHPDGIRIKDGGTIIGAKEAEERFGLWRPYDPRLSASGVQFSIPAATERMAWPGLGGAKMAIPEGQIAILFDPSLPIEPQIERAKGRLMRLQHNLAHPALGGAVAKAEARPRVEKFVTYLRVLDSKETGARDKEIAAVLFGHVTNGEEQVRNHYRRAKQIRDVDYRVYAALAGDV